MGTITTRILPTDKERMITIAPVWDCNPQCGAARHYSCFIISIGGLKVWLLYLLMLFLTMAAVGTLLSKFAKGKTSDLFISLPPLRVPNFLNITKKPFSRMVSFLKEATGFFCLKFNNNKHYELFWLAKAQKKALEPIVVNILHLPSEFSNVFIMGFNKA